MALVRTIVGDVEQSTLTTKLIAVDTPTAIEIAYEWYLGDQLVRRDGWVNMKQGMTLTGTAQEFGNG